MFCTYEDSFSSLLIIDTIPECPQQRSASLRPSCATERSPRAPRLKSIFQSKLYYPFHPLCIRRSRYRDFSLRHHIIHIWEQFLCKCIRATSFRSIGLWATRCCNVDLRPAFNDPSTWSACNNLGIWTVIVTTGGISVRSTYDVNFRSIISTLIAHQTCFRSFRWRWKWSLWCFFRNTFCIWGRCPLK